MEIIPGINCSDFECVKNRWDKAVALGARTIQIDISDGKFTPVKTWGDPKELTVLTKQNPGVTAEIHLMVEKPETVFEDWLKAGAKKLVVHFESGAKSVSMVQNVAKKFYGAEMVLGISSGTNIEEVVKSKNEDLKFSVQLLAVPLGFSGQQFDRKTIGKIKYIKSLWPNVKIRVDGGMNPDTVEQVREAGADAAIAVSYIWKNSFPAEAYRTLSNI